MIKKERVFAPSFKPVFLSQERTWISAGIRIRQKSEFEFTFLRRRVSEMILFFSLCDLSTLLEKFHSQGLFLFIRIYSSFKIKSAVFPDHKCLETPRIFFIVLRFDTEVCRT